MQVVELVNDAEVHAGRVPQLLVDGVQRRVQHELVQVLRPLLRTPQGMLSISCSLTKAIEAGVPPVNAPRQRPALMAARARLHWQHNLPSLQPNEAESTGPGAVVAVGSHIAASRIARLPGQVDLEDGMILMPGRHKPQLWAGGTCASDEGDGSLAEQGGVEERGRGMEALRRKLTQR